MRYTRKQYMSREVTHQQYYGQFSEKLIPVVLNAFGEKRIIESVDPHFNDIPLEKWDRLSGLVRVICGRSIEEANECGGVSLSDCGCAAKAAAEVVRQNHKEAMDVIQSVAEECGSTCLQHILDALEDGEALSRLRMGNEYQTAIEAAHEKITSLMADGHKTL
jgi:hypothetical protein